MKTTVMLFIVAGSLVAGCAKGPSPSVAAAARERRDARARLHSDMTVDEVNAVLGKPQQYRVANGARDDVAVYKVGDGTFTVYFYQGKLVRIRASNEPVNR